MALASLVLVPGRDAVAHELLVAPPGPADVDLGTGAPVRLVHATLGDGDRLVATIRVPAGQVDEWSVQELVPATAPGGIPGSSTVVDEATTIRYRVVSEGSLAAYAERGGVRRIEVRAGDVRSVALRVSATGAEFRTDDVARTPRALVRLRAWVEASARGTVDTPRERRASRDRARRTGLAGLGIAAAGIVVAIWWVARGRTRSRERGIERSRAGD